MKILLILALEIQQLHQKVASHPNWEHHYTDLKFYCLCLKYTSTSFFILITNLRNCLLNSSIFLLKSFLKALKRVTVHIEIVCDLT